MSPSKYDGMKRLSLTHGRRDYICDYCGEIISAGQAHMRERLTDPKINFIGKRYCMGCFKKFGSGLLYRKRKGKGKARITTPVDKGPLDGY